jgi:hypothetical protein
MFRIGLEKENERIVWIYQITFFSLEVAIPETSRGQCSIKAASKANY